MAGHRVLGFTMLLTCMVLICKTEARHLYSRQRRQNEGTVNCLTSAGTGGTCVPFQQCLLSSGRFNGRPSVCSWDTAGPVICCPIQERQNSLTLSCGLSQSSTATSRKKRQSAFEDDTTGSATSVPDPFIIGGKDALLGKWPWMALIYHEDDAERKSPLCGASLISDTALLTAAHCFLGRMKPTYVVRLGEHNLVSSSTRTNAVEIKVKKIVSHPEFQYPALNNDIAILQLESKTPFNQKINVVCLPNNFKNETFVGKTAVVTGWGNLEFGGMRADVLQELQLPIVPNSECQKKYDSLRGSKVNLPNGITNKMMCAGIENEAKDSCQGDSGGPLVFQSSTQNWVQIGIVSAGFECGAGIPGLYTRVSEFLDWISKNIT